MPKFIKKPITIEAEQFLNIPEQRQKLAKFMGKEKINVVFVNGRATLTVDTLEGPMIATEGDWIIKGIEGEFYPCKPRIFKKTYERFDK